MYEKFIEEYDGIDNGVNQYDGEPKYKISSLIGARVGSLNPRWNDEDKSEARENSQFEKAMETGMVFFIQFYPKWKKFSH